MSRLCRLKTKSHGEDGQWAYSEISTLRAKLKEAQAEIERLTEVSPTDEKFISLGEQVVELEIQLAASQANEVQLREALTRIGCDETCFEASENPDDWPANVAIEALNKLPSDTTALDAMIQKAGEVMRERCAEWLDERVYRRESEAIRAIPGVTLGDLKGGA